jgi:4-amino-4-deoxy-L-arabinose transferase-like glycosyltransferase
MMENGWIRMFRNRLRSMTTTDRRLAWLVFSLLLLLASYNIVNEDHATSHTYIHQALAFTKGSLSIETKIHDLAAKDGKFYVAFPPLPALLLVPFVFFFGTATKTLLLTPILGALTALFAYRLARKNGVSHDTARWAILGLVGGTSFLMCLSTPIDTYFAHCCAMLFGFVALNEAFGRQRGLLIGLAIGFAVLSRQLMVLTLPLIWGALLLFRGDSRPLAGRLLYIAATTAGLAVCAGVYLWLNWARFGSPFDTGYRYMQEVGWFSYRFQHWGDFSWVYIPSNLIHMFLSGFQIDFLPPSLMVPKMGHSGTALTFASPFLFYAVRGRIGRARALNAIAWVSVALTCIAVLAHKSALGGRQVNGLRYTLDFMPMLFILFAMGLERVRGTCAETVAKWLICYAVALNLIAFYLIPAAAKVLTLLPH